MAKKVLIVTYYWPPSGGPGVQRFYYFAKYLRKFGWEPIIYTIKDGQYYDFDYNLEKNLPDALTVLREKAFEPHNIYNKLLGNKGKKVSNNVIKDKKGFKHNLSVFIRGNFFIPDARKFWIKPSVKFLTKYLQKEKMDAIISTSPPQSTHLIALKLSKLFNLPWIADFRDPWTEIDYFDSLKLTKWARNKHVQLENSVLSNASLVTTVTQTWKKDFINLGAKDVRVITNGFDKTKIESKLKAPEDKFTITYIGSLNDSRNPVLFWNAIKKLVDEDSQFKKKLRLVFVGNISSGVFEYLHKLGLEKYIDSVGYVSHEEIIDYSAQSDVLLLIGIQNVNGVLPGKIFEYLNSKKPIFSISPKASEVARLLEETNSGLNADFEDEELIYLNLCNFWNLYNSKTLSKFIINDDDLNNYSRESLTEQLANLLNEISSDF